MLKAGTKKKPHSLVRTHVLDSKVTLTHRERNDGGRERREEGRKGRARKRGKKKKSVTIKRHFEPPFSGFSAVASFQLLLIRASSPAGDINVNGPTPRLLPKTWHDSLCL